MRKLLILALFFPSVAFAASGSIDVQVQNAPGEIVLDGFPTDKKAPAVLEQVPIGTHVIELEYGCMVGKADVNVTEGAKAVVKLPLTNRGGEGTLRLKGVPFGAEVTVDGAPVAKAEEGVKLPCGARRVEVSAAGFSSWSEVVVVTTGKWTTLQPTLVEEMDEAPAPRPQPAVSALDEDEEPAPVRTSTPTRTPVRTDLDELDEESEDDPDAELDEDELLARESEDELDERPESSGRGGRDEEEEEEIRRPVDEEEDEIRRPVDDEEEEEDIRRPSDDLDEEPIRREDPKRPPKEQKPFPKRGVLGVGLAGVGAAGVAIGAANTPVYQTTKQNYQVIVAQLGATDPQAIAYANGPLAQSKTNMTTGYVLGGLGAAGATAAFLLIPGVNEKDAEDLVFSPTPGGIVISGRF